MKGSSSRKDTKEKPEELPALYRRSLSGDSGTGKKNSVSLAVNILSETVRDAFAGSPGEMRPATRRALNGEWRRLMLDTEDRRGAPEEASSKEPVPNQPLSELLATAQDASGIFAVRGWANWHRTNANQRQQPKVQGSLPSEHSCDGHEGEEQRQNAAEQPLRRWWRFCGLDPQEQLQHPRDDVRFTLVVLVTFFMMEIFVNFDCGAVPCTLSRVADEFRLSPTWQGMLGALPYVGLTVASPFAGRIFGRWRAKRVIVVSMALNAAATFLMVLTACFPHDQAAHPAAAASAASPSEAADSSPGNLRGEGFFRPFFLLSKFSFVDLTPSAIMLLSSRLLVGFTQTPFVVFAPVWVDEFAPDRSATLWMSCMQGAAVVGVTVGYLCAGFLSVYLGLNWRAAICVQAAFLCFLVCIVALFPREYIETPGGHRSPERRVISATVSEGFARDGRHEPQREQSGHADSAVIEMVAFKAAEQEEQPQGLATQPPQLPPEPANEASHRRRTGEAGVAAPSAGDAPASLGWVQAPYPARTRALVTLLLTPLYLWPMLTVCSLLFVVTGIQFWGTLFFSSSLHLSPSAAVLTFAAVAATSPVAGVVMGGLTVDAFGGYKTATGRKRTLDACVAYAAAAVLSAVIASFTTNPYLSIASLWFLLWFGAAMLPPLTGVQIDAVPPEMRTRASGLSMFFNNILGYALGAFLPGVVMDMFRGGDVLGLRLVLLWSAFGLFFAVVTTVYGRRWESQAARTVSFGADCELPVHPSANVFPHFPGGTDARRSSGAQGFLPISGDASWQQHDEHQIA